MGASVASAYFQLVYSAPGEIIVIGLSLVACAAMVAWAKQRAHEERWSAFIATAGFVVLLAAAYVLAVTLGWWQGDYFKTPLLAQLAVLVPLSVAGLLAWLMGYGWLTSHTRRPLLIYTVVALLAVPAAAIADRANVGNGLFVVAEDGMLWVDALIGAVAVLTPILLFEGIRRVLQRDALP